MNRISTVITAGILSIFVAGCSTPAEQAIGNAVIGSLGGTAMGSASLGGSREMVGGGPSSDSMAANGMATGGAAGEPDYGAKKPHDHCGNGTMVHLGSVICSP